MEKKSAQQECICTVVMVSYNHAKYIKLALESVIAQKTKYKFKVHVFDDASTDGTGDIIREYARRYPGKIIPFIADKNRGAQQNIWEAYRSVDTKYCAFLECDDYWCDEKKLQMQIYAMEKNPDCSFCAHNTLYQNDGDVYRKKENDQIFVYNRNVRNTGKYGPEDFNPLYGAGWMNHSNSRLIRMSCVDWDTIEEQEDFLYDNCQFFYLLNRGNIYYIQRVMSVYVMNMSSSFTSLQVQQKIRGHYKRLMHIDEATDHAFERLIYRHLGSFSRYWLSLDDIQSGTIKDYPDIVHLISRIYKKYRFDALPHHRLRKAAKKRIQKLKKGERVNV